MCITMTFGGAKESEKTLAKNRCIFTSLRGTLFKPRRRQLVLVLCYTVSAVFSEKSSGEISTAHKKQYELLGASLALKYGSLMKRIRYLRLLQV